MVNIADDVGEIRVCPRLLKQAVINLIACALDAAEPAVTVEKRIQIQAAREGGFVKIVARDNVQDVPPKVRERLCSGEFIYSGLGVAVQVVRRVAGVHGGDWNIDGTDDGGLVVTLRIPDKNGISERVRANGPTRSILIGGRPGELSGAGLLARMAKRRIRVRTKSTK